MRWNVCLNVMQALGDSEGANFCILLPCEVIFDKVSVGKHLV